MSQSSGAKDIALNDSYDFLKLVLDSITEHIVVIDELGDIQYVNKSWIDFGYENSCAMTNGWHHVKYLAECDKAAAAGDGFAKKAAIGIRKVIAGHDAIFYLEYPCHSPNEKRWFMMRVTPLVLAAKKYFVISHHNITERRLAEDQVKKIARLDGLTNISNRRSFNEFIAREWRRCKRLNKSICMAIIDIDHFKLLNDSYGHQVGDRCLKRLASLLKKYAKRPGDICARYGGEEFAIVWGDTSLDESILLAKDLMNNIARLKIPNTMSPISNYLTVSLGLSVAMPTKENSVKTLIAQADHMLYQAKANGRNRIES